MRSPGPSQRRIAYAVRLIAAAALLALPTAALLLSSAAGASSPTSTPNTERAGYEVEYRSAHQTLSAITHLTAPTLHGCGTADSGVAFRVATETSAPQDNFYTAHSAQSALIEMCKGGVASYAGYIEINGSVFTPGVSVKPGDKLTLSVVTTSSGANTGNVIAEFIDSTQSSTTRETGVNDQFSCPRNVSCQATIGATLLQGSQPQPLPVADFATASFRKASFDGMTPTTAKARALDLLAGTTVRIKAGALGSSADSWRETFEHS